jgi:hypothetical protein
MVRLALAVAAVSLISQPEPASAQEREDRPGCTQAVETTIEDLQANFEAFATRCVRIRGIRMGHRLYSSREATLDRLAPSGESARRSIVIYPDGRRFGSPANAEWADVTGRTGSCAAENAAVAAAVEATQPGSIFMVSGYCHTSLENYVLPVDINRVERGRIFRLTEAEVPPALRSLVEAPTDRAPEAYIRAAQALVAALANRDAAAFLRLTEPSLASEMNRQNGVAPEWAEQPLREVDAAFRNSAILAIFTPLHPVERRQQRVFVEREDLEESAEVIRRGAFTNLLVCWCRTPDCEGRWPVASYDADNDPSRPYACVRATDYVLGPSAGYAIQVSADLGARGLAEPDWPAGAPRTRR